MKEAQKIAIIGGGPSGLFMFKRLIESDKTDIIVTIFERKNQLGVGMPYSHEGASDEHITNVSSNEIPEIIEPLVEWLKSVPKDTLDKYHINPDRFNEYKVLPRLLFGQYLSAQFGLLQKKAKEKGIEYIVHYKATVTDIIDLPVLQKVEVEVNESYRLEFDRVVICTGHTWPKKYEEKVSGYFDSPYPPAKLALKINHPVALKGSSLTAVDAVRTLSRYNGVYERNENGKLIYKLSETSPNFRLILHTRNGMLPAVRFHLEDSHLSNGSLLTQEELSAHILANNGFLSLDFIFERDFILPIKEKELSFYEQIKNLTLEEFVASMMKIREELNPFLLLKAEYAEAEKSIRRQQSVYWKEMLGVLSFALNYPAKYLSAEDMQRLQESLGPLISIVIAYMPQSSSEELLALYDAGIIDIVCVGEQSSIEPSDKGGVIYEYLDDSGQKKNVYFKIYIDCVGQPHLDYHDFPFNSLLSSKTISPALLKFQSSNSGEKALKDGKEVIKDKNGDYYLKVSGIAINDHFQVVDPYGAYNERIYMMAVPYIGGYNPDYSGLDFSESASEVIKNRIFLNEKDA